MPNFGAIHTYRSEVDQIVRFGGSTKETSIRRAVSSLINAYARPHDLLLVEELAYFNPQRKKRVTPDGTLKNILRLDHGFWESKDTDDDLDEEIARKSTRATSLASPRTCESSSRPSSASRATSPPSPPPSAR